MMSASRPCLGLVLASASLMAQPASPARQTAEQTPPAESPGFTYSPEGRRDPFVSPLRPEPAAEGRSVTTRPAGLAGVDVADVVLRGTVQTHEGFVAILQGADRKTYIVRAGDALFDGTVRAISQHDMVILQADGPRSTGTPREVRKVLRQAGAN